MSKQTGYTLDVAKLALVVDAMRQLLGLSQRQLAKELKVSPSTITRLFKGRHPDSDALVAICVWLNADLRTYVKKREEQG